MYVSDLETILVFTTALIVFPGPVDENRHLLCVYGAKQARVISFHDHDKTSDIIFLSDVTEFSDWIWDVHWITDQVNLCLVFFFIFVYV